MSLSQTVSIELPGLRRFSRALTGSQQSGDAYVVQLLEAMISDPGGRPETNRVTLYRDFLKLWSAAATNGSAARPEALRGAFDHNINAITPRPRQAFLLRSVEGFSLEDTAGVLETSVEDVRVLVDQAGREMTEQVATNVLIIEDEPLIALDLAEQVVELGHRIVGVARTRSEAHELRLLSRPGLVLADIRLADGTSGLDAVDDMLRDIEVPVIFVTAYPDRLLTGKRPEPTFLITKPYQPDMLKATICQALFFDQKARRAGPSIFAPRQTTA